MQCLSGDTKQPETNSVKTIDKPLLGVPECFVSNISLPVHASTAILAPKMLFRDTSEI